MHRTKTEAELAAAERAHADDPERAELCARARRFKASWIELAEALTRAKSGQSWKRWGYDSFEQYARNELHLKQETVEKLTGSYVFLRKRAPEVLDRDGLRAPIPSYQAVDFLRRAEEQEGAPEEAVREVRRRVIDDVAPLATVARQFKDAVFPLDETDRARRDAAALRNVAGRLRQLLDETHVIPRKLAGSVSSALDQLLQELGREERAA